MYTDVCGTMSGRVPLLQHRIADKYKGLDKEQKDVRSCSSEGGFRDALVGTARRFAVDGLTILVLSILFDVVGVRLGVFDCARAEAEEESASASATEERERRSKLSSRSSISSRPAPTSKAALPFSK